VDGHLVETEAREATDSEMVAWFRDMEVFTKQRFRDAFTLSGARATQLLDGYVAIGVLRAKPKGDRTYYVYRRPKPDQTAPETDGQSDSETDTFRAAKRTAESVPDNSRTDTENIPSTSEFPKDLASKMHHPLIPHNTCPFVLVGHTSE
jgi:hypothetical protein